MLCHTRKKSGKFPERVVNSTAQISSCSGGPISGDLTSGTPIIGQWKREPSIDVYCKKKSLKMVRKLDDSTESGQLLSLNDQFNFKSAMLSMLRKNESNYFRIINTSKFILLHH